VQAVGEKAKIESCAYYEANRLSRSLPPDLTISPKPKRMRTILIVVFIVLAIIIVGIYYYFHNIFILSVSIANDNIITSDGGGPYQHWSTSQQLDNGIWIGSGFYVSFDAIGPRLVHAGFMETQWKDINLKFMPSPLLSKNYAMSIFTWENNQIGDLSSGYIDPFKMEVGGMFTLPRLQIQIFFYDPDMNATPSNPYRIVVIDTIHEIGGFWTQIQNNTWINSTTAEPPQSLRDESNITLTRTSDDTWVLNVNAWFVSYYGPNLYSGNQKAYVKLTLNLTLNKKSMI
jgi:hypothetical protein